MVAFYPIYTMVYILEKNWVSPSERSGLVTGGSVQSSRRRVNHSTVRRFESRM